MDFFYNEYIQAARLALELVETAHILKNIVIRKFSFLCFWPRVAKHRGPRSVKVVLGATLLIELLKSLIIALKVV